VRYVGHVVSANGIEADPEKCEQVKNWPRPTTPEEVRRFLGFCSYYRRFVKEFFGDHKTTYRADAEPDCRQEEEGQEEYRPAET
jgi:hypothetical protein